MADFDPLTAPIANPVTVRRVNEQGFPTQWQFEWDQATRSWMIDNAVDLQTKITTVRNETAAGFAQVNEELLAIVDEQGALASQITTLDAQFGDISANGEVRFQAMATPAGAVAAYGIFLNAGTSFTGLQMIAYSGGGSAIGFSASQFMLNDSGTAQNVFDYSGGIFTFNVPIRLRTGDILDGAVSDTYAATGSPFAEVTALNVPDGARVDLMAIYEGDSSPRGGSTALFNIRLFHNGGLIKTVLMSIAASGSGSSSVVCYLNTTLGHVMVLPAGDHTFTVDMVQVVPADPGISKNFYIKATVLKR